MNFIQGEFRNHWPNGFCTIQINDGSLFQGQVIKGVMNGKGQLTKLDKTVYDGYFENGKRNGQGRYFVKDGTYSLNTNW